MQWLKQIPYRFISCGLAVSIGAGHAVNAQDTQRSISAHAITPAEDAVTLFTVVPEDPAGAWAKVGPRVKGTHSSRVLLDSAMQARAREQVAFWEGKRVTGTQLDPLGKIAAAAGDTAFARRVFDQRLAEPGLSTFDRAYTLLTAIRSLGRDAADTARLRLALRYLDQLDALPASMLQEQFAGHISIGDAYYLVGQASEAAKHLAHALALVSRISFETRVHLDYFGPFLRWADVTSGFPRGRAQIDSMVAWLQPLTEASPNQIAMNAMYRRVSTLQGETFARMVEVVGYLGRPHPPITAQFWLNTTAPTTPSSAAPGAQIKTLDDGHIRVMEFGHHGCGGCLNALPMMERLRQSMPEGVEVWLVSDEGTVWGTKRTTPAEQVQHLSAYYNERGYRFPIAIFIGERDVMDPDLGMMVARRNPTGLPLSGWPWFFVTDGHGIVRHVGFGDDEEVLRGAVQYLIAERANQGKR